MILSIAEQASITDTIGILLIIHTILLITPIITIVIPLMDIAIINIIRQITLIIIAIIITTQQDIEAHYPHILVEEG
jgi:hypothetical protein